jgi:hypothetical protein
MQCTGAGYHLKAWPILSETTVQSRQRIVTDAPSRPAVHHRGYHDDDLKVLEGFDQLMFLPRRSGHWGCGPNLGMCRNRPRAGTVFATKRGRDCRK